MGYTKGTILLLSSGDYEDYRVNGVVKVLKDFITKEVQQRYLEEFPKQKEESYLEEYNFVDWLVSNGYCEFLPNREWHFASYSSFEL